MARSHRHRPNPSQSPETSTEVFRGTQLPSIGGLRRGLSFTPVLFVAATYAARPGANGGPARFVPGSTLHRATHTGRVLVLPNAPTLGMDDVLSALGHGKPDGITDEEVRKIFNYLHNRRTGKATGGDVEVAVLDEDGEPREEEDLGIGLFSSMSPALVFRDEWDDDPSSELAAYFRASTYGFVDSPSFQAVAQRLGYGAVIYADFFEGGIRAAEELFGCDICDIAGIDEGETISGESVPTHPTLRILDPSQIHDATAMPIASVLPSIRCR